MPTAQESAVSTQTSRRLHAKIYLLNYNFQIVDEWSNVVIGEPSISINASSDIRRSCNITLQQTDSSFDVGFGNKIWLDKYVKIELGIEDIKTDEIIYTNMGIYMINNPNRVYSATENLITIEGLDLMCRLTGLRNGELEGLTHIIPQGTNVRQAIISTLALAGFNNYSIDECPFSVPNDIKISISGTVYDILKQLRDIVPQYQMYFDVDGVFHYNLIPSGTNEIVVADDSLWKKCLTRYSINTDFENVKNSITVYGKTHDIRYFNTATISGSNYILSIAGISALYNNLKIGFIAPSKISAPCYLNINSYGNKPIKNEDGTFADISDGTNVYHVVKYQTSGNYYLYMGEVTPYATVEETNPDSPFYINGTIGKIRKNFSGGEYDNIYMTSLALSRAKWELYNYCRIQDNITLECAPIYWLDVNTIIEITLPNKQGVEQKNRYIIKQISTGLMSQTITAMKYYAYYA